jgi:hypothetical protein
MKTSFRHSIREFVENLGAGTRVVWIPNGSMGTVQPDHTILWDDGHHMTRSQMSDTHTLLIHSETERRKVTQALENRLKCLKQGCTLMRWNGSDCKEGKAEELCPLAILTEGEVHLDAHRRRRVIRPVRQYYYEPFEPERGRKTA